MNKTLLTVSGTIDPKVHEKIQAGERPDADYVAMSKGFEADLIDYVKAREVTGRFGSLIERFLGANLMLAWACFLLRRSYRVIFTDGEQIGIPLAMLLKFFGFGARAKHLMIVHILSVGKKQILLDILRLASHIDIFFVYATWQKKFIESRWNVPADRVVFTPFMVDHHFFSEEEATGANVVPELTNATRPYICAVGLEFRDYPTLMEAVDGLDMDVVIAAASPWSKREDSTQLAEVPDNVTIRRFSQYDLRDLYLNSAFFVMPLYDVNFQAGVTALLEAMSMGKAVICSQTPGQTDVVVADSTGLYVPPGEPKPLREAIVALLNEPATRSRMGIAGRQRIEQEMSLVRYVERLSVHVERAAGGSVTPTAANPSNKVVSSS